MTDTPPTPSTSAAPTITPTKAAQLRLDTLSFLIHGATPSTPTTAPALLRLSQIISTLTALSSSDSANKPISRLLDDWDDYADLLSPLPLPEGDKEVWDAQQQASYLLSQQVELQQALQALDGIQRLVEERKVLDADLSRKLTRNVEMNEEKLRTAQQGEATANRTASTYNARLMEIVQRWSQYTSTLSQAFTLLDHQVWDLERQLSALERRHTG